MKGWRLVWPAGGSSWPVRLLVAGAVRAEDDPEGWSTTAPGETTATGRERHLVDRRLGRR